MAAMNRALTYIEDHLGAPLTVKTIAQVAGYSPFHFDRVFRYALGEPLMAYVRKRRLTEAAGLLVETDMRIIDIAVQVGFASQQAFSTTFAKYFEMPPGRFRKQGLRRSLLEKKALTLDAVPA